MRWVTVVDATSLASLLKSHFLPSSHSLLSFRYSGSSLSWQVTHERERENYSPGFARQSLQFLRRLNVSFLVILATKVICSGDNGRSGWNGWGLEGRMAITLAISLRGHREPHWSFVRVTGHQSAQSRPPRLCETDGSQHTIHVYFVSLRQEFTR